MKQSTKLATKLATKNLVHGKAGSVRKHGEPNMETIQWQRNVPLRYEADVAVIGGGLAGVCAAAAAARSGAKVVLVERFGVTGGLFTTGGVAHFDDARSVFDPLGEVFTEILADMKAWNAIGNETYFKPATFHYETLAVVLQELLLRRGVKLLLHTRFVDARVTDDGRITEVLVCGMSGLEALRARQFIDCSGESALARAAGFGILGDWATDPRRIEMSLMVFVREVADSPIWPSMPAGWSRGLTDVPLPQRPQDRACCATPLPEGWCAASIAERIGLRGRISCWPDGPGGKALKLWLPTIDSTDTESMTAAEIQTRRCMMEVVDYQQRVEKKPWRLDHAAPIVAIRDGALIAGDYVLTQADLLEGRRFDDAVARGTYHLHLGPYPQDMGDTKPHQIPLRCLVARDGLNLLMAGRNLSAEREAQSSARVATSSAMMGQAVGIAAALAVEKKVDVRDLDPAEVRAIVLERGARLEV